MPTSIKFPVENTRVAIIDLPILGRNLTRRSLLNTIWRSVLLSIPVSDIPQTIVKKERVLFSCFSTLRQCASVLHKTLCLQIGSAILGNACVRFVHVECAFKIVSLLEFI